MALSVNLSVFEVPSNVMCGHHCIMNLLNGTLIMIKDQRVMISPRFMCAIHRICRYLSVIESWQLIVSLFKYILIEVSLMLCVKWVDSSPGLFHS